MYTYTYIRISHIVITPCKKYGRSLGPHFPFHTSAMPAPRLAPVLLARSPSVQLPGEMSSAYPFLGSASEANRLTSKYWMIGSGLRLLSHHNLYFIIYFICVYRHQICTSAPEEARKARKTRRLRDVLCISVLSILCDVIILWLCLEDHLSLMLMFCVG